MLSLGIIRSLAKKSGRHFGTGDLEVTIKSKKDISKVFDLIKDSYQAS